MWPASLFALLAALLLALLWRQSRLHARWRAGEALKYADDARREQQAAVAQFQVRQQALFNGMIEGVLMLDKDGRVRMINESFRKFFDTSADVRGKTIMEAFDWPELAALAARLPTEKNITDAELEIHRATRRCLQVNAAIVHDHADLEQGQLFVFHDITRQIELENFRKEFVANVSHELRTPLSLIKGYAQTLLDGARDDPAQAMRFLQKIDKHADRLHFLMEDLLAISHLESGQATLNCASVNLQDLAQRVIDDLAGPAAQRSATIENKVPEHLTIWADAERLQQVLFNLMQNAIKYGRAGGCVTVGASGDTADKVEIFVADDGPGIPPGAIGRVFERFYRVDRARSRETGGTGLGLAIVKHIIQAHGGEAWVKSEWGKGASFFFTLPRKTSVPSTDAPVAEEELHAH